MHKTQVQETARVEFRIAPHLKKEVEEAAALVGASFTSFATEVLVERSRQIRQAHGMTLLRDQERDAFMALLSQAPEPTEALVDLMHVEARL